MKLPLFGPLLLGLCALLCWGQAPTADKTEEEEERQLNTALSEAGNSPVDFIRALEAHLAKFPKTKRTPDLERALAKAAIENKDDRRIVLYGERVLARESEDLQLLDRVARALLKNDDKETSARALKYARKYGELVESMRKQKAPGKARPGQWEEELDRGSARSLVLQARATGNLGNLPEAISLAERSYAIVPTAEAAREVGRWLVKAGREAEAISRYADAFVAPDARTSDADRAHDRGRMGELYRKLHGNEKGLGDLILEAYDRASAVEAQRQERLSTINPNARGDKVLDFTLTAVKGDSLQLSKLKGKTLVLDFWATWCAPCRVQHPLYEEVKQRFRFNSEVVFLSVDTDDDRSLVEPFLKENKWDQAVYFDDGLARLLQIASIPTTVIIDKRGEVVSRMNGFLPNRFVDMLSERIKDALKN